MTRLVVFSSLAALTAHAAEFAVGGRTLVVPEGFEVELAAGPPLVERPISADFDEQGRLYITDSSGSNDKVEKQLAEKPHRVVRLEDSDGDGRYDKSVVFADRMMFPEGAMWLDGSLYIAAPPCIWKLTDTDGDGIADQRDEWFQGRTLTGCANDLHGPYLGPDGWIYWCKGAFAKQTYEHAGREPFVTRASHIFRCRPDRTGFESVMTGGMDNPVELAFTAEGERILTATFFQHPAAGRRDGLIHAVYGKPHDVLDGHVVTGELMPLLAHLGPAAPTGLARYRGAQFGPEFRGDFFAALFNLHKITRHHLAPDGSTFASRDEDFLVSPDHDFHPTDVLEDADGSLLVVDTGGWYKLCCPTSQLYKPDVLGAIYRVRRKAAPVPDDPRGMKLAWNELGPPALAALLSDSRPAVRDHAAARLSQIAASEAVPALAQTLRESKDARVRQGVVWSLTRIDGAIAREVVRSALGDAEISVRHAAAHSAGIWRDRDATAPLVRLLGSDQPQLQRAAAEALGRIGDRAAVPALLRATPGADRVLEHSIIYALIEISDRAATAAALRADSPAATRAALIALDQMPGEKLDPKLITPFLSAPDAALKKTAAWIVGRTRTGEVRC